MRVHTSHIERTIGGKFLTGKYDWQADPNGYRLLYEGGSFPDPVRCLYCGFRYVQDSQIIAYCGVCSKAMSMGGEKFLRNFDPVVENARIRIPDKYIDLIDWNRIDINFVIGQIQTKYKLLLANNKNNFGWLPPPIERIGITFEEIEHKIPYLTPPGERFRPDFKKASEM